MLDYTGLKFSCIYASRLKVRFYWASKLPPRAAAPVIVLLMSTLAAPLCIARLGSCFCSSTSFKSRYPFTWQYSRRLSVILSASFSWYGKTPSLVKKTWRTVKTSKSFQQLRQPSKMILIYSKRALLTVRVSVSSRLRSPDFVKKEKRP